MKQFVFRFGKIRPRLNPWDTLQDLRDLLADHCTPAHFDEAVSMMGQDPYSVASYLCIHDRVVAPEDAGSPRSKIDARA